MVDLIKLVNGDEIIGKSKGYNGNGTFLIEDPLLIEFRELSSGAMGMMLVNYIPFSLDNKVYVKENSIVAIVPLDETVVEYYEKSLIYTRKYQDVNTKKNVMLAVSQLDIILETLDKSSEKKDNRKGVDDLLNKVIIFNKPASSNTVN